MVTDDGAQHAARAEVRSGDPVGGPAFSRSRSDNAGDRVRDGQSPYSLSAVYCTGPTVIVMAALGHSTYRLMLLGRAAPVVNARLPLTEACAHGLRGLWPEAEDCHRQHRHRIGVHNSHAGGSGA